MTHIEISIPAQTLTLKTSDGLYQYLVSTALRGVGQQMNTGCTPKGRHYIRAKIGAELPLNAVLVGRRPTGEIYSPALAAEFPNRDWILTRILWLCGLEKGLNRLGSVDTQRRYIYIHGTPDSEPMGVPRSHGCIRMRNEDLVDVFEKIQVGCLVDIIANE
jgi:L,D-transpeptidase YbiS